MRGAPRAGARGLRLLADPVNVSILRRIGSERRDASELLANLQIASRSTCFNRLRELEEHGVLVRESLSTMPRRSSYWLPQAGIGLVTVAADVEGWLQSRAQSPVLLESAEASVAIKALGVGWNTKILHRLGRRSASLTELDREIGEASYHHLRHAVRIMLGADLVRQRAARNGYRPYGLTQFGRRAAAALASLIRWESIHFTPEPTARLEAHDAEALLMLPAPLVELPPHLEGSCRVEVLDLADVTFEVAGGRVVSCRPRTNHARGRVRGSRTDWRAAMSSGELGRLEIQGDDRLATQIVEALRGQLLLP
jgi:DNA-binding HxlR family transcriptional regulator